MEMIFQCKMNNFLRNWRCIETIWKYIQLRMHTNCLLNLQKHTFPNWAWPLRTLLGNLAYLVAHEQTSLKYEVSQKNCPLSTSRPWNKDAFFFPYKGGMWGGESIFISLVFL
jgi:hypothetical protein